MKQYVAAKAERIELTLFENIAFSGGEIIPASCRIAHIARNTAQTAYLY